MFANHFSRLVIAAIFCAAIIAGLLMAVPDQAQTFTVVGVVPPTGGNILNPSSIQITQGRNGDVYAVSSGNQGLMSVTTSGTFAQVAFVGYPSGVTLGTDGNLYTNFPFDRIGCGEVIKTTPSGTSAQIASICGSYGNEPDSAPIQAPNGIFYGTASGFAGGSSGTIYSMTSSGTLGLLHTFTGADGSGPIAPLVVGSDGNLYGGTTSGGTNNDGVLFRITPSGTYTVLHNFTGSDGAYLAQGLCLGSDGNLYGVATNGGTDTIGVFFKLTNSGTYTVLYNFLNPYSKPNSSLVQATDGNFYGLLAQGNGSQPGWIYSVTPTGTFTILHAFCQLTNCADGETPSTPLIQHTDGKLYGFTAHGGNTGQCTSSIGCGVFYSFDVGLGPFVTLGSTSGKEGAKVGIFGQGFSSASVVKFGGTQATTITRSGTTFINATVPAVALTGPVTVTTGTTTLTSTQTFKVKPGFTSFSPPSGTVGTAVTITGTELTQTTKVEFNGKSAAFTVNSDTQVTATVPTGATTGRIGVTTKGGIVASTTSFTVN